MSHHANQGNLTLPNKENWTGKLGIILAVAGSAVGLGNFLRFPGQAVNNGGGAFMIPYLLSFLLLGIPICWCEWTMGRLGGRHGQNSPPGIYYCVWRSPIARVLGVLSLCIFCIRRVFREPNPEAHMHAPLDIDTHDIE